MDDDVVLIFTHILQHFYRGGIGLRQICDWCRFLWTYRNVLNNRLLESRIRNMGIMTEWKAFASLAVEHLGMPREAMPLYNADTKWIKKGDRILSLIFYTGNFGHSRDLSYYEKFPYLIAKLISLHKNTMYGIKQMRIFPMDSLRELWRMIGTGIEFSTRKDILGRKSI